MKITWINEDNVVKKRAIREFISEVVHSQQAGDLQKEEMKVSFCSFPLILIVWDYTRLYYIIQGLLFFRSVRLFATLSLIRLIWTINSKLFGWLALWGRFPNCSNKHVSSWSRSLPLWKKAYLVYILISLSVEITWLRRNWLEVTLRQRCLRSEWCWTENQASSSVYL